MKRLAALAAALVLLTGPLANTGNANHEYQGGHWSQRQGQALPMDYNCGQYVAGVSICSYVGTGATTWLSWGGPWILPPSAWGLTKSPLGHTVKQYGWITVNVVSTSVLGTSGGQKVLGRATTSTGSYGHILYSHVEICGDCGKSWQTMQSTVTHELGHALGLAHNTAETGSVMCGDISYCQSATQTVTWHDWVVLYIKYNASYHPAH